MRKIYEKIADWLADYGVDKYLHLLACLVITFVVAVFVRTTFHDDGYVSASIGACGAMMVGFFKEWWDNLATGGFGCSDLIFDAVGCLMGAGMLCVWTAVI